MPNKNFSRKLRERHLSKAIQKSDVNRIEGLKKYWGSDTIDKDFESVKKKTQKATKKAEAKIKFNKKLIENKIEKATKKGNLEEVSKKLKTKYGTKLVNKSIEKTVAKMEKLHDKAQNEIAMKTGYGIGAGSGADRSQYIGDYYLGDYAEDPKAMKLTRDVLSMIKRNAGMTSPSKLTKYIQNKFPGSKITGELIYSAARKAGVSPMLAAAMMQKESRFGTDSRSGTPNNPFNIKNTSTNSWNPDTLAEGITAGMKNLKQRRPGGKYYKEAGVSDYGKGGVSEELSSWTGGGYDNVTKNSGYDDVVGYKSGGNYYSINTYTGEKVKTDKASYKALAKIDKKDYENIKTSLDTKMAKSSKGNALNKDQLAALKAVRPDLAGKNSKQLLDWWKKRGLKEDPSLLQKVNDYTLKTGGSIGGGEGGSSIDTTPSYDLKNDPNYKALPDDLKKVATYFETVGLSSNTEQGTRLIQSLQTAADQSNAYYKQFFNIAADTMIRTNDEYQQAFGSKSDRLNKQITQINEDLAKNKEFMTLEEQSDLTRLANEYKANLQTTQGTMAAAGLTQSTIRSEAEQRLAAQNKGLVEDTQRQYGKRIADLETAAARGNQEAQADLADLKAKLGYNITQLGRDIETQVGSASMPALSGYTPLGNITGSLVENRTKDIAQRAGGLLGDFNLESLNLTL